MSDYLSSFVDAVRAKVATVWPDVLPTVGGGIWDEEFIELVPWDGRAFPYAVLHFPEMDLSPASPLRSQVYDVVLDIYRVQQLTGPSDSIRAQLVTMQQALFPNTLTAGQIAYVPRLSWNSKLPPNAMFAAKNMSARAGVVRCMCKVGYTP